MGRAGDAFREPLSGTPRLLDTAMDGSGGELWAMEIDPQAAVEEFREAMQEALGAGQAGAGGADGAKEGGAAGRNWDPRSGGSAGGAGGGGGASFMSSMGMPDLKGELSALLSGTGKDDSLLSVPGSDEVVAMTKVVTYLDDGFTKPDGSVVKFDRIVLDTAPTGHTLRMLQLPEFMQELVGRMKAVRDKAGSFMGGGGEGPGVAASEKKLEKFEAKMKRLELLLHNPKECEFAVVTIPTELATAETRRLLQALQEESIAVRRVIINQVIPQQGAEGADAPTVAAATDAYLNRLRQGQQASLRELQQVAQTSGVDLISVPYFDTEVRTVYGLRLIGMHIFPPA